MFGVSCPDANTCMAVGDWFGNSAGSALANNIDVVPVGDPGGALDQAGAKHTTSSIANLDSRTTWQAVAAGDSSPNVDVPADWQALIYILSDGTWQLQPQPPLPANYQDNLNLQSVSCPDSSDCFVAASYGYPRAPDDIITSQGLILTYSGGTWSDEEAPLPANAVLEPNAAGLPVLYTIDCADVTDCVAGGGYVQQNPTDTDQPLNPLLLTLQDGTWTPSEGPVPADSAADTLALITGMSCPAVGSCIGDGYYWQTPGWPTGNLNGMLLTQSSGGWNAVGSGYPAQPYLNGPRRGITDRILAAHRKANKSSVYGISCVSKRSCHAVGNSGNLPLILKMKRR
jgi:hypothetical protein